MKDCASVIVGIDFGTAGIGYAFSFEDDPSKIIQSDFPGQSQGKKVPTEIILSPDSKLIYAFGLECNEYIKGNDDTKYEYYRDIKMNLYKKMYKIKSTNGKEEDIELIISKLLEKVSGYASKHIERINNTIKNENIKWVLTVPAIWEEKSKQIMINAPIKAGLIKENDDKSLFLALEPEVASIYFLKVLLKQKDILCQHINEGQPFIVCDIGAGTVDICTHRRIIENRETLELIEEYPPIGGDYGGHKINEEFIKRLIIPLFGEEKVKKLQKNNDCLEEWTEFEKKVEELKTSSSNNLPISLYLDCHEFEEEGDNKTLDDFISEYNKKNLKYRYKLKKKKKKWMLELESKIFYDIMDEFAQKIFSKIEEIYNSVGTRFILLTGAGSYNNVLRNYIMRFAGRKNIHLNFEITLYPETAIMQGAVLFGFQRDIIRKRKAKFTLGIKVNEKWNDKYKEKGVKEFLQSGNDYYCIQFI